MSLTDDFDPRPLEHRGTAQSLLPALLDSVRGDSLGVSVMFDPRYRQQTVPVSSPDIPVTSAIQEAVATFKESLIMSTSKLQEIEQNTRAQRDSLLWFSVRKYRITASKFGEILHHRANTTPDRLVLSILQPRSFSSAATDWGVLRESFAIQEYLSYQHDNGHEELIVGPCGFAVCESHSFLGVTPDGTVYDPSNAQQPFGFIAHIHKEILLLLKHARLQASAVI